MGATAIIWPSRQERGPASRVRLCCFESVEALHVPTSFMPMHPRGLVSLLEWPEPLGPGSGSRRDHAALVSDHHKLRPVSGVKLGE